MRFAVILVALLLCRSAAAQALDPRPDGAAGLALAGCGATGLRGPAAVWSNPALLPLAESRLSLELGLLIDSRQLTSTEVANQPAVARDLDGGHLAPAVAFAHPLGVRWLWGAVAYRLARQVDSRYPAEELDAQGQPSRPAPGRYLGTELTLEQHVVALAVGAGGRRLAAGVSLEASHVRLAHRRALWAGLAGDRELIGDPAFDLDARLDAQNTLSVGGALGAWASPWPWLELGAAVRLPSTATLEGEVTLTPGPRAPAGSTALAARGAPARLELPLPLEVQGGAALRLRRWRLMIEAGYQRWSSADQPVAELSGAALVLSTPSGSREQPLDRLPLGIALRDSLSVHLGLEFAPWGDRRLVLRTGYAYHRGASEPGQPSPVLLDLDRHTWGAGVQARVGWLILGAAFAHSFEANSTEEQSQAELFNPLDSTVTTPIGAGRYQCSRVQVIFEAGAAW